MQNTIFFKEVKMTHTPTSYILVSLRPALRKNQCSHMHTGSVDFQWSKETRMLVR